MSRIFHAAILTVLQGDEELSEQLRDRGMIPHDEAELGPDHLELARVTQTLLRELDVNWPGIEIILRMRRELIDTRKQIDELVRVLHTRSKQ